MTELCSNKRRGFNLIEAAIVLGVVGLVVAGIWIAASTISEKREINNVKEFILYEQGVALKYSQHYPLPSNYLSMKALVIDGPLPGGFRVHYQDPTTRWMVSENNKIYVASLLANVYSQDGYNVSGSFNWWVYFLQEATASSWTYVPRPGVCAGLLSWVIAQAATRPVLLGYMDAIPGTKLYWDARTGAAPPTLLICNTVVELDVFIW